MINLRNQEACLPLPELSCQILKKLRDPSELGKAQMIKKRNNLILSNSYFSTERINELTDPLWSILCSQSLPFRHLPLVSPSMPFNKNHTFESVPASLLAPVNTIISVKIHLHRIIVLQHVHCSLLLVSPVQISAEDKEENVERAHNYDG